MHPLIVLGLSKYPGKHVHLANPFDKILHCVLGPHGEGSQGFSGNRHGLPGGLPSYSGKQKQRLTPFTTLQPELGPHVFGLHSSPSGTGKE